MSVASFLGELVHSGLHMALPGLCEGCGRSLLRQERVLCLHCCAALPRTDFHGVAENEAALRLAGRVPFEQATSFAYFRTNGLVQHLLHRLKYGGRKEIGHYLGMQAGHALSAAQWGHSIDAIVPVPLHPKKEAKRGFNQSEVIARGLGKALSKPVQSNILRRGVNTSSQTKKSREERVRNMLDAFYLPGHSAISGRHLLLLDDVLTTGATLEAAAGTLLREPGVKVSIFTVAIAM